MNDRNKKISMYLYIVGLIFGFIFVRNALNLKSVEIRTKNVPKKEIEIKAITVKLNVNKGMDSKLFDYKMTNSENVLDLLRLARKSGAIYFETTEYSSRIDLDFIDYKFNVFLDGNDITDILRETKLVDGKTYTLRLTSIRTEVLR